MKAFWKAAITLLLIVLGLCALGALLTMVGLGVHGNDNSVVSFGHHQFPADALFDDEIVWAPLVWLAITFAYVIAAVIVVCALALTAFTLLAVALLLGLPMLLIGGLGYWLWRRCHDVSKPHAPTTPPPTLPPTALA